MVKKLGTLAAAKVDMHFDEVIDQIAINPFLFPSSDKIKNIRQCVISPQTTLYYRFNREYVELVSFRGSRMNPESLDL